MFELCNVSIKVGKKALLSNVNLRFEPAQISAVMGANGAGKSTLFKCLLGEYPLAQGHIKFNKQCISDFSLRDLSKQRAYIAQAKPNMFSMLVLEYLLLARIQYIESSKYSENLVLTISKQFSVTGLLMRDVTTLSGGEMQLIEFVRAYLQLYETHSMQGKCLLLDEPASALDIKQTRLLYKHLTAFQQQSGTVIIIDHDINQVGALATNIAFIKHGGVQRYGESSAVFTQSNLDECFDTKGRVVSGIHQSANFYHLTE